MVKNDHPVHQTSHFRYIDAGSAPGSPSVILLHGMLGGLENWTQTLHVLALHGYRTVVPSLPVYDLPLHQTSVSGLVQFLHSFIQYLGLDKTILVGNSLGGHLAILYAAQYPAYVEGLVLSGASGIYEVETGTSVPRRHDRNFIREKAELTFYDPIHVTEALVDEMYHIVTDRQRVLRLIKMARATKHEIVTPILSTLYCPTLLIWGREDQITPPYVAVRFKNCLPRAQLQFIDHCGHAPMIEHPEQFNNLTLDFLKELSEPVLAPKRQN